MMANPGKHYNLPCSILYEYGWIDPYVVMLDYIKIGRRRFQVNSVPIEVE